MTARDGVKVLTTDAKGFRGTAWHVEIDGKHYVISAISNEFATETMAFVADERGQVEDYAELVVVRTWDHEACIAALLNTLGAAS